MPLFPGDSSKIQQVMCKSTDIPVIADVIDLGMLFPFSELLLKRGWVTTVGFTDVIRGVGWITSAPGMVKKIPLLFPPLKPVCFPVGWLHMFLGLKVLGLTYRHSSKVPSTGFEVLV